MSDQDWAADNLNLRSAGQRTMKSCETLSNSIKSKLLSQKLTLLIQEPYDGPYLCCLIPIIFIMSLLFQLFLLWFRLFQISKLWFGCVFIAENRPIGTSITGNKWAYKPWASRTQSSSTTKVPSPMAFSAAAAPGQPDRSYGCTPSNQRALQA